VRAKAHTGTHIDTRRYPRRCYCTKAGMNTHTLGPSPHTHTHTHKQTNTQKNTRYHVHTTKANNNQHITGTTAEGGREGRGSECQAQAAGDAIIICNDNVGCAVLTCLWLLCPFRSPPPWPHHSRPRPRPRRHPHCHSHRCSPRFPNNFPQLHNHPHPCSCCLSTLS
jgi:hypothetical protein